MGYQQQTRDLTNQYLSFGRVLNDFRPVAGANYAPGTVVQLVALDLQVYPDMGAVAPTPASGTPSLVVGVVCESWVGFSGAGLPTTFVSAASQSQVRGTQGVLIVEQGYHPSVLIDNSGAGSTSIANGVPLIPSKGTVGYAQSTAVIPPLGDMGLVGNAMLPASGFGASLGSGALVQASQTATIATAQIGDVITLTLGAPFSEGAPGVPQTQTFSFTTTSASPTTNAQAFTNALNGNLGFSQFFTASFAAGVMTITVNALGTPFLVTYGTGRTVTSKFSLGLSGTLGNAITIACAALGPGTTTFVAGGATLAGGTGYKGAIPAFITGANC